MKKQIILGALTIILLSGCTVKKLNGVREKTYNPLYGFVKLGEVATDVTKIAVLVVVAPIAIAISSTKKKTKE